MLTIFVANMDESLRFYTEIAGMKLLDRFGNEFAILTDNDGLKVGLHPASAKSPAGKMSIGIQVPDSIHARYSELKNKGVQFTSDVADDGQVLAAHFNDPNGVELYLVEIKQQKRSA